MGILLGSIYYNVCFYIWFDLKIILLMNALAPLIYLVIIIHKCMRLNFIRSFLQLSDQQQKKFDSDIQHLSHFASPPFSTAWTPR